MLAHGYDTHEEATHNGHTTKCTATQLEQLRTVRLWADVNLQVSKAWFHVLRLDVSDGKCCSWDHNGILRRQKNVHRFLESKTGCRCTITSFEWKILCSVATSTTWAYPGHLDDFWQPSVRTRTVPVLCHVWHWRVRVTVCSAHE